MRKLINSFYLLCVVLAASCRPTPIDIEVPQQPPTITLSSATFSDRGVLVAAAYSANSLVNLEDSIENAEPGDLVNAMFVDSATVTIAEEGQNPVTLRQVAKGVYGSMDLNLTEGKKYHLTLTDNQKGIVVSSSTTFVRRPDVDTIFAQRTINGKDTVCKLNIRLNNVNPRDRFFVAYNTSGAIRSALNPNGLNLSSLNSFEPKRLELITGEQIQNGTLQKEILLKSANTDTLIVTVGKTDEHYFKYLDAYKRTGYLINQLTGEPINLPSNVTNGYGYFALYTPIRYTFDLNK